ncbi:MAG: hypothetical protein ABW110_18260 [Steroidobacteraceae bacterium]
MSPRETPEQLEKAVERLLRDQPLRPAPASLSRAVLGEVERRVARPWWRSDFARWPVAARGFFFVGACLPAVFAYLMTGRLEGEFTAVTHRFEAVPEISLLHAIATAMRLIAHVFSNEWLIGSAVAITALYAAVFGLGVAGYRVLYARR